MNQEGRNIRNKTNFDFGTVVLVGSISIKRQINKKEKRNAMQVHLIRQRQLSWRARSSLSFPLRPSCRRNGHAGFGLHCHTHSQKFAACVEGHAQGYRFSLVGSTPLAVGCSRRSLLFIQLARRGLSMMFREKIRCDERESMRTA